MEGLNWQTLQLPFAAGLDQKSDDRARKSPALDIAKDVQFDELGGIQTRLPYATIGASIHGGGTISNPRRIVENGSELLLFTKDTLYAWSANLAQWVSKGTHLAVKVEEQTVFATVDDQFDPDRAELNGVVLFTWGTGSSDGVVSLAAYDKTTGAVILEPTEVDTNSVRPHLVALGTVVMLTWVNTSTTKLFALPLNVSSLEASLAATPVEITNVVNLHYDIVRIPGLDQAVGACRCSPTTSYQVFTIDAAGAFSVSTKARTCTGAIAVACPPTATSVQVVRGNGVNVEGDLITISGFVDTAHINKAIGATPLNVPQQIAACFSSTIEGSDYRCRIFWHSDQNDNGGFRSQVGSVTTGGSVGSSTTFVQNCAVSSRAFDRNGDVYVHLVFAGNSNFIGLGSLFDTFRNVLQNTTFLYRYDGFLVAKILGARSGEFTGSTGCLPHVELTGTETYSWAGTERRAIDVGSNDNHRAYDDRGPCNVTITFDSNEARRCLRFGETLYITGGELLQYDGVELTEVGFHIYPWSLTALETNGAGGSIEDGTYAIKATFRSDNARGERDRSTTATHGDVAFTGGTPQKMTISGFIPLATTHKNAAVEFWRTKKDPTADADFYLTSSKNPATTSNPNRYVINLPTSATLADYTDELSDASLEDNEASPENGSVLENVAPPACTIIAANENRIFLSGIAGRPDAVMYSKYREAGLVAGFNDGLAFDVPRDGGKITALAFLNETLIVFREHAIYAVPGEGLSNTGEGGNYGPSRMLSGDVGAVNHESVVFTPGGLVFKSSKGWYLLNRGWSLDYIGGPVADYDSETPLAAHLVEKQHQVRILTSSRLLVWDYLAQQWAEWTITNGVHACMWSGLHVVQTSTGGPQKQATSYNGVNYGLDVETAWIKPADLQGFVRVRKLQVLGAIRSTDVTHLRIRIAYNYDETYVDDEYWPISPVAVGKPLQVKIGPQRPQLQAIKIRIGAIRRYEELQTIDDVETLVTVNGAPTGEAIALTGLALDVGMKRGAYPRLPAAQRS